MDWVVLGENQIKLPDIYKSGDVDFLFLVKNYFTVISCTAQRFSGSIRNTVILDAWTNPAADQLFFFQSTHVNQVKHGPEKLLVHGNCERSLPGLRQLNCWHDRQRAPLQDGDDSGNDHRLVPGFLRQRFGMFPNGSGECPYLWVHEKFV